MTNTFAKTSALVAVMLAAGTASFADTSSAASTNAQFQSYEVAQTIGMDHRQDRREDRRYDRNDRRDDRQTCRQNEGIGIDKRNCKQDGRQDRNMNG